MFVPRSLHRTFALLCATALATGSTAAAGDLKHFPPPVEYSTRVVVEDLIRPTGIDVDHQGHELYFTEVPTPGVSGANGGANQVSVLNLRTGELNVVDFGDPEGSRMVLSPISTCHQIQSSGA